MSDDRMGDDWMGEPDNKISRRARRDRRRPQAGASSGGEYVYYVCGGKGPKSGLALDTQAGKPLLPLSNGFQAQA